MCKKFAQKDFVGESDISYIVRFMLVRNESFVVAGLKNTENWGYFCKAGYAFHQSSRFLVVKVFGKALHFRNKTLEIVFWKQSAVDDV